MGQPEWTQGLPTLSGTNVAVREVVLADAPVLAELLTDISVAEHVSPPPQSIGAFEGFIAWSQQQRAAGLGVCFGIVPHGLQAAVGIIQVRALDPTSWVTVEWGFALASAFWATGTFVDAANLVCEFAFDKMGVHRMEGRAVEGNGRGNGALLKLGAKPEGSLKRGFKGQQGYDTQIMWGLTAEDWRERPLVHPRYLASEARAQIATAIASVQESIDGAKPHDRQAATPLHPFFLTSGPEKSEDKK